MSDIEALRPSISRWQRRFLIVGIVASIACAIGAVFNWTQFAQSYLLAYFFWLEFGVGCFSILMLHHLVGGRWGYVIRRPLEAGSRTLPFLALLFVPLYFAHPVLYPVVTGKAFKADYLNPPFFFGRAVLYFALWILFAYSLNKWSSVQDTDANPGLIKRLQNISAPGLLIYCFTITFAAIDWISSLEPKFFSTIWGMIFVIMPALAAMSFIIVVTMLLAKYEPLSKIVSPERFNDLGNLLLVFVMLWAYLSFSQFLIIWAGNLQDEIPWYTVRGTGEWSIVALFIILFHFAVPFVLLLNRPVKRKFKALSGVGIGLIVMSWIDLYWFVVPSFHPVGPHISWMDIVATIGIGGLWLALFASQLKKKPLVALRDPRFSGVVQHG